MQHPCSASQKPRTMAAVSPLHQVVPQPNISPFDGNSLAFSASRTSSFAAALRKLAKQAVDPVAGEKDLSPISPVSSPALSQGSVTPKRTAPPQPPPPMYLNSHQVAYSSTSPPVVTIAPSRPHVSHNSDSRKLQVMDLTSLPPGGGTNNINNGHLVEPLSLKLDSAKSVPRNAPADKWEDHTLSNKVLPVSSGSSQARPHATIAPLPRPDDSLTSSRGFQPYRGVDDVRAALPHHIAPFDHHHPAAAYPYSSAFLPPPHLPHPAYRFDDPLYLERYSLLRSPVMPFPPQPGIMGPPAAFYPNSRYAADLLAQSLSLSSASNNILNHERLKQEEERRHREKEMELDHSRSRDHERERIREKDREKELKEKEQKERDHKEREMRDKEKREREKNHREQEDRADQIEYKKVINNSVHSVQMKRTESPNVRNGPVIQFTANRSSPPVTTASVPLNLVVHPSSEHQKRETELWLPWQQQPVHHNVKENHEEGVGYRHPLFLQQENQRLHVQKENATTEKMNVPFNPAYISEKKHPSAIEVSTNDSESQKYLYDNKKYDTIHHHITELSNKEYSVSEWKHEKLQKLCINNHKKNFSNESKKHIKEEPQNSIHHNQRKQVNGLIVKSTQCQDEGMHARLLETEKCRIEFNGQITNKGHVQNQVNDKLPVPMLKPLYVQINGKDINSQKMYIENHITSASNKNRIESPPVISKLDKDAEELQKKLQNGIEEESEDDNEEILLNNFLFITKGPPLSLDITSKELTGKSQVFLPTVLSHINKSTSESKITNQPKQKMNFFKIFGLTSQKKKNEIELEKFVKRRKILRECCFTPPLDIEEKKENDFISLCKNYPNLYHLSEKLRSETSSEKLDFVLTLGLNPVTLAKKEEKERLWRVIQEERSRRHHRILAKINKKGSPYRLLVPKKDPDGNEKGKRKTEKNQVNVSITDNRLGGDGQESHTKITPANHNSTSQDDKVPSMHTSDTQESAVSTHALIPATKSHFQSVSSKEFSDRKQDRKIITKYSYKRGHSLKHERKKQAPPLIPLKNNHHVKIEGGTNHRLTVYPVSGSHISTSTQVDTTLDHCSTMDIKNLKNCRDAFQWPGLETVMEAYYRHQGEQTLEKEVLTERCHHLKNNQEELKTEADHLSRSLSELLKLKRELDEERQRHQQSIDHLKQCMCVAR